MKLEIGSRTEKNPKSFELVMALRDKQGNPTGITKSFQTDDVSKLHEFWIRNSGQPKKKKKRNTDAATGNDVANAVKEAEHYTNNIREKRNLED